MHRNEAALRIAQARYDTRTPFDDYEEEIPRCPCGGELIRLRNREVCADCREEHFMKTGTIEININAESPIHSDNIDSNGVVTDAIIETFYTPIDSACLGDGYVRIFADNGGTDIETRIPFGAIKLIAAEIDRLQRAQEGSQP